MENNGRKYHHSCYRCTSCLVLFDVNSNVLENNDLLYCEEDYNKIFVSRCARCSQIIQGKCISALGVKFHPEHFICNICNSKLSGSVFIKLKNTNSVVCKPCFDSSKRKPDSHDKNICSICFSNLNEDYLLVNGEENQKVKAHPYHFKCNVCNKDLNRNAQCLNNRWYCQDDFIKLSFPVCHSCKNPIQGISTSYGGNSFHPEHFVCATCKIPLGITQCVEFQNNIYCHLHFAEITRTICGFCYLAISSNIISAVDRKWCPNHFICFGCGDNLSLSTKFFNWDKKPLCSSCYDHIGLDIKNRLNKYNQIEKKVGKI
ncbi:hypothetical protein ROZALSC1DRAFT_15891 [Rozella allomycis CSF55]|uniref:LIM zinc-binding domain-containing protein n=1 Tax=Rozella allomycis (strain CSF55) TaxID=988480 RepID=A0A4P9YEB3_ROZAC|nr:hypothetical protein ROZALSC1DRAFT_15891 [Rozella allomycis CSF55]